MSDLPDEWAVVPVHTGFETALQSVEYQSGVVVIYSKESGGEWIQSDSAVNLTEGGQQ